MDSVVDVASSTGQMTWLPIAFGKWKTRLIITRLCCAQHAHTWLFFIFGFGTMEGGKYYILTEYTIEYTDENDKRLL